MRVLLRPVPVPELGLVVLKPGRESMQVFHNPRVLVEPEPKSMRGLPSGVVPAVRQPLAEDKSLLPFFSDERVIRAAGGAGALSDWLLRHIKSCQWPHGDYHHSETVIHRYGTGAMVLCWHCDNQLRNQTSESLGQLAHQNLSAWMIDVIRHAMNGTQERELSLAELSWWATINNVADALPETVLRRSLGLRAEKIRSVYRESDIVPGEQTATSMLKQRTKNIALLPHAHQQNPPQEKTVVSIAVDPHHIIGHGLGGMGTKADDLFVIPLCRKCHSELHAGVKDFEEKHGSQLLLLIRFLMHARNSGVLKWKA
ncbi:DUF968 domain-containing protein [Escherichia coli]|uniref:DUF968 domain-containing protein n=2 Tax=Escherichia coli TaxID=562 RepID=UPI0004511F09|nr:DUF968 domain-containing protein [Escherichia coli]EEV0494038.1 DUF968 domain-containing protein [Escherichia coli O26]EIG4680219.1 DUF968 domain-containing protein [Shigella sonnei]EEC7233544.1 DUF968 domain-containing protein [Escherichia coli]EEC9059310.1 DUF968 domain-containing protein [Escherichia coli]EEC9156859.1 DUF968 domain-containing protein [Escherichia coli]